MKRQGVVNLVAALASAALLLYVLSLTARAWAQFGASGTVVVLAVTALVLASCFAVYAGLAVVFFRRAVSELQAMPGGVMLRPDTHSPFSPVLAPSVKRVRSDGKFVLFKAANRLWVAPSNVFSELEVAREV